MEWEAVFLDEIKGLTDGIDRLIEVHKYLIRELREEMSHTSNCQDRSECLMKIEIYKDEILALEGLLIG